jgi:hypothetical protein
VRTFVAILLSGTPAAVNQLVLTQLYNPEGSADTLAAFLLLQCKWMPVETIRRTTNTARSRYAGLIDVSPCIAFGRRGTDWILQCLGSNLALHRGLDSQSVGRTVVQPRHAVSSSNYGGYQRSFPRRIRQRGVDGRETGVASQCVPQ